MKIVSYNINDCQLWKIDNLLRMGADVLVVPEITCPGDANLPETLDMKWCGIEYFHHQKNGKGWVSSGRKAKGMFLNGSILTMTMPYP